jgi:hypothetical protein
MKFIIFRLACLFCNISKQYDQEFVLKHPQTAAFP